MLIDNFKRKIEYLRVSVTDRCDLRCTYCMVEDMKFLPRQEVLSIEEVIKLISIFNKLGVKKYRLTGGEPLVRKGIVDIIEYLNELKKKELIQEHTLTTNGTNLNKYSEILKKNGVDRINVSLDTLNPERFKEITRWGDVNKVLEGIQAALDSGIKVKINTVVTKDFNDDELIEIINWSEKKNIDVSLIEVMPIGSIGEERFDQYKLMSLVEKDLIEKLSLTKSNFRTNGPSRYFERNNSKQKIGFISALSHNFCDTCNRIRLTCTGKLFMCLGQNDFVDLKYPLREQNIEDVIKMIEYAMTIKPKSHDFEIKKDDYKGYINRYMNQTGG
jgi:cyclic pyranopterin phosphate synthase